MKIKRLLSVFLSLIIMCMTLPVTASAAITYDEELDITDLLSKSDPSAPTLSIGIATGKTARLYTNVAATVTKPITITINSGSSVYFEADLQTAIDFTADLITIGGSGSIEINGSDITGSTSASLVKIEQGLSSVLIKDSEITNTNASKTSLTMNIGSSTSLDNVDVTSEHGQGDCVCGYSGDTFAKGLRGQFTFNCT